MSDNRITAIRGFKDILPIETKETRPTAEWRYVESVLTGILDNYGFSQIRLPLVEETQLFARGVGTDTDIVAKEMFSVSYHSDKTENNESASFALRPEGTAGAVRAIIEHNLTRGDTPKLWYMGAMFRYERPQKGRYRQFHQLGVESFGSELPDADAELIAMTADMWQKLGIAEHLTLQLNSLGESDERQAYKTALVEYLNQHFDKLDEDSQRRVTTNPLRVLDSKIESTQAVLNNAPRLSEFLGEESNAHFEQVKKYLTALGIKFEINEKLVRGLDYYNKTVFEWVTDKLGSQATVCGGGRYDGLIGILKGKPEQSEPAVGFAMGLERLILLINEVNPIAATADCDVFVVAHPDYFVNAMQYAHELRQSRDDLRVKMASATSLKAQMKKADKSGAKFTVILGENEVANDEITIKDMRTGEQRTSNQFNFWFDESNDENEAWGEYISDWWDYFAFKTPFPYDLLSLLTFTFENDYNAEGDLADGFYLYVDNNKSGLKTYSDDPAFLDAFYEFAQADGTGSTYAYWHYDKTQPLDQMPIVAFGSEGGVHIVAKSLRELLQILTYDVEPMIDLDDFYYYKNDDEDDENQDEPSDYHDEFVEWLKENFDLDSLDEREQVDEIIANAQEEYGEQFKTWFEQYVDG